MHTIHYTKRIYAEQPVGFILQMLKKKKRKKHEGGFYLKQEGIFAS